MAVTVRIPTPLREFTGDKDALLLEGATVGAVLQALEAKAPGICAKVLDENGKVRRFVNIYAGEEDIRFLDGVNTPLADGAEVSIIPAIAGGR